MKKQLLLLFSVILSFNSYSEWTQLPEIDADFAEQGFIDFDNIKRKSDGYVYWWMMLSRADSSEKVYSRADCEEERMNPLQGNFHNEPMGQGESTSIQLDEGWTYPAPDTVMYRFLEVVCEMADETPEQRAKSIKNLLISLDYKKKINDLYEKEVENEEYKRLLEEEIKADEDSVKSILNEEQLNTLKSAYVNNIAAQVKSFWRYQSAEDDWTAEVYVVQDRDGTVVAVDVRNANVDDSSKAKVFKDSIRRAVYKASPLPSAPDEAVFAKELIFVFGVN